MILVLSPSLATVRAAYPVLSCQSAAVFMVVQDTRMDFSRTA